MLPKFGLLSLPNSGNGGKPAGFAGMFKGGKAGGGELCGCEVKSGFGIAGGSEGIAEVIEGIGGGGGIELCFTETKGGNGGKPPGGNAGLGASFGATNGGREVSGGRFVFGIAGDEAAGNLSSKAESGGSGAVPCGGFGGIRASSSFFFRKLNRATYTPLSHRTCAGRYIKVLHSFSVRIIRFCK